MRPTDRPADVKAPAGGKAGERGVQHSDLDGTRAKDSTSIGQGNLALPAGIASDIRAEHQAALAAARDAVAHAIRAGELLLEAKAALGHGEFGPWLAANVEFSARTAQGYMQLAKLDDQKRNAVADLSLRRALDFIATPPDRIEGECPDDQPWEPHGAIATAEHVFARETRIALVAESRAHPGFYWLSVLSLPLDEDQAAIEEYLCRPVRRDGVSAFLAGMRFPDCASTTWHVHAMQDGDTPHRICPAPGMRAAMAAEAPR
jgi:hypothetical protein